jgi:eukaryotic-like serine/threonine-protein kinase
MSSCPDEESLIAMAHGKVPADVRAQLMVHIDGCAACLDTLAVLMLEQESEPVEAPRDSDVDGAQTKPIEKPRELPLPNASADAAYKPGQKLTPLLTIQGYLGGGGMGAVYKAFHAGFGKQVAVKVLKHDVHSSAAKTRLFREARALSELPPNHVVRVYDVSELPTGEPYVVMDLLVGSNLRDWFEEARPIPISDVLSLLIAICKAVESAHERGIVHRDLKPENIFVLKDGSIRILDFGLSKLDASMLNEQDSTLTRSNAFLGTPLYVAPEQVREATKVDTRADVWALGVVFYEALTGTTPFRRKTVGAVLAAVLSEPAPLVRTLRADTPESTERLIASCLALETDKRPRDAGVLAGLLERERNALLEARELLALQTTEPLAPNGIRLGESTHAGATAPSVATVRLDQDNAPEPRSVANPSETRSSMGNFVAASSPQREAASFATTPKKRSKVPLLATLGIAFVSLAGTVLYRQATTVGAPLSAHESALPAPDVTHLSTGTQTVASSSSYAPYIQTSGTTEAAEKAGGTASAATGPTLAGTTRPSSAGAQIQVTSKSAARPTDGRPAAPSATAAAAASQSATGVASASTAVPNREFGERK